MIRRFNYTGRKRIERSRVVIEVKRDATGTRTFDATLNFDGLDLPADAAVRVEAYYQSSYMPFEFGTVAARQAPADRRLIDIDRGDVVLFRVKVVDRTRQLGCILAEADAIAPHQVEPVPAKRNCLLPVVFKDLGPSVWRLQFDIRPILEVNSRIPGVGDAIRDIVRSDSTFFALVYPAVIRQILTHILVIEAYDPRDEDPEGWSSRWLRFVRTFHSAEPPPPPEGDGPADLQMDWIDDAVRAFCARHDAASRYGQAHAQEER